MPKKSTPHRPPRTDPLRTDGYDRKALERAIQALLAALPHDPDDPEIERTPARVAASLCDELLDGYGVTAATALGRGSPSKLTGVVAIRSLDVHGMCPHHLLPWRGVVDVAYRPAGRVAGLGRVAKLVDVFAHRLALQEDVAQPVADALVQVLGAKGAAVRIRAVHDCLALRGERRPEAKVDVLAESGDAGSSVASLLVRGAK